MRILAWGLGHDAIIAHHSFVNWTVPPLIGGVYIKTEGTPSLQSVTIGSYKSFSYKKIFHYIKTA